MFRILFTLLFIFFLPALEKTLATTPQEDYLRSDLLRHDFDEAKRKSLADGLDYSKDILEEQKPDAPRANFEGLAIFLKYLFIAIGIGLLVFLFYRMATGESLFSPSNRKLAPAVANVQLKNLEENLPEAHFELPIIRAVEAGDYALAVRLHFLFILKELTLKNHIRWKRDKTNGEYLRELSGSPLAMPMREVTLIFERVWYGKLKLEKDDYTSVEKVFQMVRGAI